MGTEQQLLIRVKNALKGADLTNNPDLSGLYGEYIAWNNSVAARINECAVLLQKKLKIEAVATAQQEPSLFEQLELLLCADRKLLLQLGELYDWEAPANIDFDVVEQLKSDAVSAGELTLAQTSIGGNLQFNGHTLLLQGTVELAAVDSDSETLTITTTAGNMAKWISNGGIQVSGELNISGVMDANFKGTTSRNGIRASKLTIDVIGDFEVYGGHGADATAVGAPGYDGAAAIFTGDLTIDIDGSLKTVGGTGGTGANGYSYEGANWVYRSGNDGGAGGAGGMGGSAIQCENIYFRNADQLDLCLTSGNGGKGGKGGKGEPSEAADKNPYYSGDGGSGGRGGQGGTALAVQAIYIEDNLQSLTITHGSGGNGGNGGNGGDANKYWFQYSTPGNGGAGGIGGTSGVLGVDVELLPTENVVINDGTNGSNGSAGTRGAEDAGPR
jgi:hypothetical protein